MADPTMNMPAAKFAGDPTSSDCMAQVRTSFANGAAAGAIAENTWAPPRNRLKAYCAKFGIKGMPAAIKRA